MRQEAALKSEARRRRRDRRLAAAAVFLTFALFAAFWLFLYVPTALAWSQGVLALCLVVAAGAARALLGAEPRAEEAKETARSWRRRLIGWPVVALAALLPYLHSLTVGFLSDDFGLYYGASHVATMRHAFSTNALPGFLRPLSILLWWGGAKVWAGHPIGYHAANLLLHAGSAALVYALGKRWTGSAYGAFAAGMLFAVHPLHVETVVWAACNADLLSTFFALLALLGADAAFTSEGGWRRAAALAGSSAAFGLALMGKESALALPGVVFLFALFRRPAGRAPGETARAIRRAVGFTLPYAAVLAGYLIWRYLSIGSMGGYRALVGPWNLLFPTAPLRHLASFLFPLNRALVGTTGGMFVLYAVALIMAAWAIWLMLGLRVVPGGRLALWLGFFVLMSVPVWILPAGTMDLEHSRFTYLPTIGLVWLFGDICAGRGIGWKRSGAVLLATLVAAGTLTVWYVTPWRAAHRQVERIVDQGAGLVNELESRQPGVVLYVQGLPSKHLGAQVMRNCLAQAIALKLGKSVSVRTVAPGGDVPPEVFALSTLTSNEYLAAWSEDAGVFKILRRGAVPRAGSP